MVSVPKPTRMGQIMPANLPTRRHNLTDKQVSHWACAGLARAGTTLIMGYIPDYWIYPLK